MQKLGGVLIAALADEHRMDTIVFILVHLLQNLCQHAGLAACLEVKSILPSGVRRPRTRMFRRPAIKPTTLLTRPFLARLSKLASANRMWVLSANFFSAKQMSSNV